MTTSATARPRTPKGKAVGVVSDKTWQRPFIELFTLIGALVCLLCTLIPAPPFPPSVLPSCSAGFSLLWVAFRAGASVQSVFNAANLLANLLVLFLLYTTGGVLSVAMVWYFILVWLPFVMLSFKAALAWVIFQFNALLLLLLASQMGWLHAPLNTSSDFVIWDLFIKIQAVLCTMFILDFLSRSQQQHLQALQTHGDELQALHLELIRAQSHKDEFIASVGHELRTPMNAILGLNGVLKDQIHDSPEDLKRVDLIRESTQHLLTVVNDILDYSQLQAHKMSLGVQSFSLRALAEELVETLKLRAERKKLKTEFVFDPALEVWISADAKRFKQLVNNILENAVKFTSEGQISLRFKTCDMGLRVEVQDTGIGMSEEQRAQVFGRFEKTTPAALKLYGGTGLGLSICDKLVQLQGGHIGVESQVNHGSLFWFELPLLITAAPSKAQGHANIPGNNLTPQLLLIVDDHPVNLMVAQRMVHKLWPQAQILTANTGESALKMLQDQAVDVILMDMFMPDMDGMQVTQAIRQLPSPLQHTPVLGVTASSNAIDHQHCMDAGMNDVVFKPLEAHELQSAVLRCMQQARGVS